MLTKGPIGVCPDGVGADCQTLAQVRYNKLGQVILHWSVILKNGVPQFPVTGVKTRYDMKTGNVSEISNVNLTGDVIDANENPQAGTLSDTITYGYDPLTGSKTSKQYADGKMQSWDYTASGQLKDFTDIGGWVTSNQYGGQKDTGANLVDIRLYDSKHNLQGQESYDYHGTTESCHGNELCALQFGNGMKVTYDYTQSNTNPYRALANATTTNADGELIHEVDYAYNNQGQLIAKHVVDYTKAQSNILGDSYSYHYDAAGRLATVNITGTDKSTTIYHYDDNGNITALSTAGNKANTESYQYNAEDQLISVDGARPLKYDANGNVIVDDLGNQYHYNAYNQLESFTAVDDNKHYQYGYYPSGMRQYKSDGQITLTFYNDGGVLTNTVSSAGGLTHYLIGQGHDIRYLEMPGKLSVDYFLNDHHGDVSAETDATGKLIGATAYDSFGNILTHWGSAAIANSSVSSGERLGLSANPFAYDGEYRDAESGLVYLNARYYNPRLQRFMARDSYPFFNRYAFGNDDPVGNIDPTGHFNWGDFFGGLAIAAGVVATVASDGALAPVFAGISGITSGALNIAANHTNGGLSGRLGHASMAFGILSAVLDVADGASEGGRFFSGNNRMLAKKFEDFSSWSASIQQQMDHFDINTAFDHRKTFGIGFGIMAAGLVTYDAPEIVSWWKGSDAIAEDAGQAASWSLWSVSAGTARFISRVGGGSAIATGMQMETIAGKGRSLYRGNRILHDFLWQEVRVSAVVGAIGGLAGMGEKWFVNKLSSKLGTYKDLLTAPIGSILQGGVAASMGVAVAKIQAKYIYHGSIKPHDLTVVGLHGAYIGGMWKPLTKGVFSWRSRE
ncbi:RHS repeat domain-containing protein [Facilibium subflavum]|uniref:RHS repeat domain-containing protein n=1 Tax=Facilibium subflavum TaxID=2219058 RepID=UPI000E64F090|nr:RHS repeat-associated core domain-containing protein [Facilibium subflavum]